MVLEEEIKKYEVRIGKRRKKNGIGIVENGEGEKDGKDCCGEVEGSTKKVTRMCQCL